MSKYDSHNQIKNRKIIDSIIINDITHYLIEMKDSKKPLLLEENELTKLEIQDYRKSLLKKKCKREKDNSSEKVISLKKIKDKNRNESNKVSSCSSCLKDKKTINKKEELKKPILIHTNPLDTKKSQINNTIDKEIKEEDKENNKKYNNNDTYKERDNKNKRRELPEREGVLSKDTPHKILNVGYINEDEKNLYCLVEWKQSDNIKISDSIIKNSQMKKAYPELLIDYYESKIIFLDKL